MLTDTHAHLDFDEFAGDFEEVMSRAERNGVRRIVTIGTSLESSRRGLALAEKYPQVYAAVGVHPCYVMEEKDDFTPELRELLRHPKAVAVGETGLDLHHRAEQGRGPARELWEEYEARQRIFFAKQLEVAAEAGKNVVVHERGAWEGTREILLDFRGRLRCVFHCFVGSLERAQELAAEGNLVSFTGIATFKGAAEVHRTLAGMGPGEFLFETDCPFLAPVPYRGKRCEPAHTRDTAEFAARLRGEPLSALCAATERAAEEFFRFPDGR